MGTVKSLIVSPTKVNRNRSYEQVQPCLLLIMSPIPRVSKGNRSQLCLGSRLFMLPRLFQ
jgi:hypothetical protein